MFPREKTDSNEDDTTGGSKDVKSASNERATKCRSTTRHRQQHSSARRCGSSGGSKKKAICPRLARSPRRQQTPGQTPASPFDKRSSVHHVPSLGAADDYFAESLSIAERALQGFEGVTFARGHLDRLLLSLVALETPVGKLHQLRPKSGSPIDGGEIEVLEVPKKLELPLFLKVRPKKKLAVFAFFFWLASSRNDDRC